MKASTLAIGLITLTLTAHSYADKNRQQHNDNRYSAPHYSSEHHEQIQQQMLTKLDRLQELSSDLPRYKQQRAQRLIEDIRQLSQQLQPDTVISDNQFNRLLRQFKLGDVQQRIQTFNTALMGKQLESNQLQQILAINAQRYYDNTPTRQVCFQQQELITNNASRLVDSWNLDGLLAYIHCPKIKRQTKNSLHL